MSENKKNKNCCPENEVCPSCIDEYTEPQETSFKVQACDIGCEGCQ